MNFLTHPAINKAYIALLLYGENTSTTRSKLMQKVGGSKKFTPAELEKLEAIREQIKSGI